MRVAVHAHRRQTLVLPSSAALLAFWAQTAFAEDVEQLANDAMDAYNKKDLDKAYNIYSKIMRLETDTPVWAERRGQVQVDMKRFNEAIQDFNDAEEGYRRTIDPQYVSLGLLSNRALAHEGLDQWNEAIADYDKALAFAGELGFNIPYVLNSRGNCHASLAALVRCIRSAANLNMCVGVSAELGVPGHSGPGAIACHARCAHANTHLRIMPALSSSLPQRGAGVHMQP
jgi:tetratricopeptide (TPR) repeat protein